MSGPPPSAAPPPYSQQYPQQPYAPPPPKRSHAGAITAVVIVVILVVVLAGLYAAGYLTPSSSSSPGGGSPPAATVDVTAVNFAFSGASNCWKSSTGSGGILSGGQQWTETDTLSYTAGFLQPSSCTVQTASVATPGFSLVNANVPLVVDSGGSLTLSVTLTVPTTSYTGPLTIDLTDTSP
jgi:hypothetical protein